MPVGSLLLPGGALACPRVVHLRRPAQARAVPPAGLPARSQTPIHASQQQTRASSSQPQPRPSRPALNSAHVRPQFTDAADICRNPSSSVFHSSAIQHRRSALQPRAGMTGRCSSRPSFWQRQTRKVPVQARVSFLSTGFALAALPAVCLAENGGGVPPAGPTDGGGGGDGDGGRSGGRHVLDLADQPEDDDLDDDLEYALSSCPTTVL